MHEEVYTHQDPTCTHRQQHEIKGCFSQPFHLCRCVEYSEMHSHRNKEIQAVILLQTLLAKIIHLSAMHIHTPTVANTGRTDI